MLQQSEKGRSFNFEAVVSELVFPLFVASHSNVSFTCCGISEFGRLVQRLFRTATFVCSGVMEVIA